MAEETKQNIPLKETKEEKVNPPKDAPKETEEEKKATKGLIPSEMSLAELNAAAKKSDRARRFPEEKK